MKKISVKAQYFKKIQEAVTEIQADGLYLQRCFTQPEDTPAHWHRFTQRIYIEHGDYFITDTRRDITFHLRGGARVDIPEGVVHSEVAPRGYVGYAGYSVDPAKLEAPVNLDPDLLPPSA